MRRYPLGPPPAGSTVGSVPVRPPRNRIRVGVLDFSSVLPAAATRLGSYGPPVHLRLTGYDRTGRVVLAASAMLAPLAYPPANRCRLAGYLIEAQVTARGVLTYYRIS